MAAASIGAEVAGVVLLGFFLKEVGPVTSRTSFVKLVPSFLKASVGWWLAACVTAPSRGWRCYPRPPRLYYPG